MTKQSKMNYERIVLNWLTEHGHLEYNESIFSKAKVDALNTVYAQVKQNYSDNYAGMAKRWQNPPNTPELFMGWVIDSIETMVGVTAIRANIDNLMAWYGKLTLYTYVLQLLIQAEILPQSIDTLRPYTPEETK